MRRVLLQNFAWTRPARGAGRSRQRIVGNKFPLTSGATSVALGTSVVASSCLRGRCKTVSAEAASIRKVEGGEALHCRRFRDTPVPGWFKEAGWQAFRDLDVRDDDVVMVSVPKCGTTWVHKILHLMLRMQLDGSMKPEYLDVDVDPSCNGQVYPEGLPLTRPAVKHCIFGFSSIEGLVAQPPPRFFVTHVVARLLPTQLDSRGRVVYVVRNPKDALVSLHFFRGEAKDGWLGNEHGPGSYARFMEEDCPNAYGSYFGHLQGMQEFLDRLGRRATVVYYEHLQDDLPGEVARLASFLGVAMSPEKLSAICEQVSFDSMKHAGGIAAVTLRKGSKGDWKNYLDAERWKAMDETFEARVGLLSIAAPLRAYM